MRPCTLQKPYSQGCNIIEGILGGFLNFKISNRYFVVFLIIPQTEYEGHAKDKAGELKETNAIVVAGGDGTLGEVITGLLRRDDEKTLSSRWPVGIIPVGASNTLAKMLYTDSESEVR